MSVVPFNQLPGAGAEPSETAEPANVRQPERNANLEELLKQGRAHLLDLRSRLQQATMERERLQTALAESRDTHERDLDQLRRRLDHVSQELGQSETERERLTALLDTRDAELAAERHEIATLREAAERAQAFAREIVRLHDRPQPEPVRGQD